MRLLRSDKHFFFFAVGIWLSLFAAFDASAQATTSKLGFRGALLRVRDVTAERLDELRRNGFNHLAIVLDRDALEDRDRLNKATERVSDSSLQLYYWIEVARCPELAEAHPAWMASLQTHDEWRRYFPDARQPKIDEVAKTYPWVPILSREPFAVQLTRVKELLGGIAEPQGVFLNDLQGAPSACGCGNTLCRWTSDYGKRRTTVPLGDDAAALFVDAVRKVIPKSEVIPVWTTECEQHDGAADGLCAGVGCFDGICWKAYTQQLMPLAATSNRLGVLTPFKAFQRDTPFYGRKAGWIEHALASFAEMPPKHGAQAIPPSRLIAVLQGWNASPVEIAAQIAAAEVAGANGFLLAYAEIEQDWQPKIVKWK